MPEMIRDKTTGKFLRSAYPKLILSPCIFCGAEASLEYCMPRQETGTCEGLYPRAYWVQCTECGARGPELDKDNAVSEWEAIANRWRDK